MNTLTVVVDLEKISIDEVVFIEDIGKKDASGQPVNRDASFKKLVEILNKAVRVEGFDSIGNLPFPEIRTIMNALLDEVGKMGSLSGPTMTSGSV